MTPQQHIDQILAMTDRSGDSRLRSATIRELASLTGVPSVTSFYLDVDGRSRPRSSDVNAAVDRLFRRARRHADARGVGSAVEADLVWIRDVLDRGVDRSTTRGLALFVSSRSGLHRELALAVPVRDEVHIGPHPYVAPLAALVQGDRLVVVVLVDRRRARLFRCEHGAVSLLDTVEEDLPRAVDTEIELGDRERARTESALRHARRTADSVIDATRDLPGATVALGGDPECVAELQRHLPAALRAGPIEHVALAASATPSAVGEAVAGLQRELERRSIDGLLARLAEAVPHGAGTLGIDATLRAIAEQRVETLLVAPHLVTPGARCPACGWAGTSRRGRCPVCARPAEPVDDLVELAVDDALGQGADVVSVDADAWPADGIGALLRWA
jgi:peptide chain release factor subunit 1